MEQHNLTTGALLKRIFVSADLRSFINENKESFQTASFQEQCAAYLQSKSMSKEQLIARSGIERIYTYRRIAAGKIRKAHVASVSDAKMPFMLPRVLVDKRVQHIEMRCSVDAVERNDIPLFERCGNVDIEVFKESFVSTCLTKCHACDFSNSHFERWLSLIGCKFNKVYQISNYLISISFFVANQFCTTTIQLTKSMI